MTVPHRRPLPAPDDGSAAETFGPTVFPAVPASAPRRVRSQDLLGGSSEIEIDHAGATYRLRLTALGKLILTK